MHFGATFTIDANTLRWSRLLAPKKLFSRQNRVSVLHSLVRGLSPRYSRLPHHTLVFGSCPGSGNSQTIMFPSSETEDAPDFFRSYTKISDWSKSFVLREFGLSEAFVWCVLQFCQAADRKPVSWRRRSEEKEWLWLYVQICLISQTSARHNHLFVGLKWLFVCHLIFAHCFLHFRCGCWECFGGEWSVLYKNLNL